MKYSKQIVIIEKITDRYAELLNKNFPEDLKQGSVNFENLVLSHSDSILKIYTNLKLSLFEKETDYYFAYILGPTYEIIGFYKMAHNQ